MRDDLVDGGFTALLTLVGVLGFRQVYGGQRYLAMGVLGVLAGIAVAYVTSRLPAVRVTAVAIAAGVLLAGIPLRDTAFAGMLPSVETVRGLSNALVFGWKQLLTTVRPVGDPGHLLALPYLLALVSGVTSYRLSLHKTLYGFALLPPAAIVALSILFGSAEPAAAVGQGAVFVSLALAWIAVRHTRGRGVVLARRGGTVFRVGSAVLMLAVSFGAATIVGPRLPLATARPRTVLQVEPPIDPSTLQSPLAGFRRFTDAVPPAQSAASKTVLTVRGAAPGEMVRLATLDHYDGKVWGVANRADGNDDIAGFARIGSALPPSGTGAERPVSLMIGEGYSDAWVPSVGAAQSISFGGPRADQLRKGLRYNAATRSAVVTAGFTPGDVVELRARRAVTFTEDQLKVAEPNGAPLLDPATFQFVAATATKFAGGEQTPMARVLRIGTTLRTGAYSHGKDSVQSDPGHGMGRIATFLQGKQLVGDDEQYGAAMALMANASGVPARVVLAATPRPDGTVTGREVQVGVELNLAGHGWVLLPADRFTPPRDRKPEKQPKEALPKVRPKVVPPPMRVPPATSFSSTESELAKQPPEPPKPWWWRVLMFFVGVVSWTGPPIGLVGGTAALILLLKARRRRRRQTTGSVDRRVAMGWTELLDTIRDLGLVVENGTRREQARSLAPLPVGELAVAADGIVFGPAELIDADAHAYWQRVDAVRAALTRDLTRWRRARVSLSLRSLVPALARTPLRKPAGGVP